MSKAKKTLTLAVDSTPVTCKDFCPLLALQSCCYYCHYFKYNTKRGQYFCTHPKGIGYGCHTADEVKRLVTYKIKKEREKVIKNILMRSCNLIIRILEDDNNKKLIVALQI